MQKKLIALAIAGLAAAPAFAQTNVTIYGVVDLTLESVKSSDCRVAGTCVNVPTKARVQANSSLLGFRGTEDLGNGLSALFQIESSITADNTGGTLAGRDTFVGLKGGFGTVRLGVLTSPTRGLGARQDYTPGATGIGATTGGGIISRIGGAGNNPGFDDRMRNAVRYDSPSFAGLTVSAQYGANENKEQDAGAAETNDGAYGLGLNYANGPIFLAYTYERRNDIAALDQTSPIGAAAATSGLGAANTDNEATSHRVGGEWNFGMGKVGFIYDRSEIDEKVANGELKRDAYGLLGSINVGPGDVFAHYIVARDLKGTAVAGTAQETGAKNFVIGYNYPLSKRTTIKAHYAQMNNDDNASYGIGNQVVGANTAASGVGFKERGLAVGIRHTF